MREMPKNVRIITSESTTVVSDISDILLKIDLLKPLHKSTRAASALFDTRTAKCVVPSRTKKNLVSIATAFVIDGNNAKSPLQIGEESFVSADTH
jgi:hypothetical protein